MNNKKSNIKYDNKTGLQQWAALLNGTGNSTDQANAIAADAQNNVYVTGFTTNPQGNEDYTTVSYSPAGQLLWLQNYDGPAQLQDYATALAIDKNNSIYVTGASVYDACMELDYLTIKYQQNGTLDWVQRHNSYENKNDIATNIIVDTNYNIYVCGASEKNVNRWEITIIRYWQEVGKDDDMIVLGKQLEDPYDLNNMLKAYNKLKDSDPTFPDLIIEPNYQYLRFLPKTEEEWEILKSDTSVVFFDFPLDYEIKNTGTYYQDPSLLSTDITWQYCVLPLDYVLPEIEHELLYEVFIPPIDDDSELGQIYAELEYKSAKLTGNLPKDTVPTETVKTSARWPSLYTPSGYVRAYDERFGIIPINQVPVIVRTATKIKTDLTNSNGYFETSRFRLPVQYYIKWERANYTIRDGIYGVAWLLGPLTRSMWFEYMPHNTKSNFHAHIHRAAYTYYYATPFGIKTPPKPSVLQRRIQIRAYPYVWGGTHYMSYNKFYGEIHIFGQEWNGTTRKYYWRSSESIFGTTIHELAHASHWQIGYNNTRYLLAQMFSEPFLPESWATGVEAAITSSLYMDTYMQNQNFGFQNTGGYTPIVWDMMDTLNQGLGNINLPFDSVENYTLKQLEGALYGSATWLDWQSAIRDRYVNSTEIFLEELFNQFR